MAIGDMSMNDEIKEINIPNNTLAILGDLTNGALNYYKAPKTIELKHKLLLDYMTNLQEYKLRNEKAIDKIQQLIDNINNKTIIGLNNFLPKLEETQDELADGVAEMSV